MSLSLCAVILAVFAFLLSGTWIALSLLATAGISLEIFSRLPLEKIWAQALWNSLNNWALAALPMFIFLGEIIMRTRMSHLLFEGLKPWVQFIPGRLLHTNVFGSAIFAAVSGSSPATVATIGKITLGQLEKDGYDTSLSYGSLAGAGTLGLLIPPSIVLIIYGVLGEVSIGRLFIAGVIPGVLLACLYSGYVAIRVLINPALAPTKKEVYSWKERYRSIWKLLPVTSLILFILGSIYTGFATPSEAAALGVLGGILIAALLGDLTIENLLISVKGTINTSAMICFIIVGASFLSVVMGYLHIPADVAQYIGTLGLSASLLILLFTLFYIILGFFLDGISMIVMTLPITLPLAVQAGFDPVWFGIFLVLVIEAGQITPPVGFNLFVLQGLTREPLEKIVTASIPFFLIIMVAIVIITIFPGIVLFLPNLMIKLAAG
ncbi:MAG: C4-dicarboxylate ABC transporter permease [Desulfobacterales bacterium]|nr:MAG: C4-dicarboxylate ABC transporter permease [Desulfobacterales bacterium]